MVRTCLASLLLKKESSKRKQIVTNKETYFNYNGARNSRTVSQKQSTEIVESAKFDLTTR